MSKNNFCSHKNYQIFIKVLAYRREMSEQEDNALFAELLAGYLFSSNSHLMDLLEDDKFLEFKSLAKYMHDEGGRLKKTLTQS